MSATETGDSGPATAPGVTCWRKRPVVIEAMHWDGYPTTATTIIDWMLANDGTARYHDDPSALSIDTLEGTMTAVPGDWVIKGVAGEFYSCREEIFAQTYEPAGSPDPAGDQDQEDAESHQRQANEAAPVSREGQERSGDLSAAEAANETAERAGRAAYKAYASLRTEQIRDGRVYPTWDELDLTERFAWEVAAVAAADAERARLYAALGNDHYVTFTHGRWAIEHSVECRLSGRMSECAYHQAVATAADDLLADWGGGTLGRWRITGISEGLPDLERADPEQPG